MITPSILDCVGILLKTLIIAGLGVVRGFFVLYKLIVFLSPFGPLNCYCRHRKVHKVYDIYLQVRDYFIWDVKVAIFQGFTISRWSDVRFFGTLSEELHH